MDHRLILDLIFVSALVLCAEYDIAFRRVPNEYVFFLLLCGVGNASAMPPDKNVSSLAAFFVFMAAALPTSRFWRGHFGGADVKIIAVILLCVPLYTSINVVAHSFMACGLFSIVFLAARRIARLCGGSSRRDGPGKKDPARVKAAGFKGSSSAGGIPFAPFLAAAYISLTFGPFWPAF